jgi:SAM-dependent methyltransferase
MVAGGWTMATLSDEPDTHRDVQASVNTSVRARGRFVQDYATADLRPPEITVLLRHRDALAGRVLELGCGAGRLTRYLTLLAEHVHGIDVSEPMLAHCRATLPQATFSRVDLRDLTGFGDGSFDAVVAPFNVLDVLDDAGRREVLGQVRRILPAGGLLVMSSHNRAYAPRLRTPVHVESRSPRRLAANVVRLPRRLRNHRRLAPYVRSERDYAVLNDEAHDYSLLHYYVGRDAQDRQFRDTGFELVECLDLDARPVAQGEDAPASSELHYVARRGS